MQTEKQHNQDIPDLLRQEMTAQDNGYIPLALAIFAGMKGGKETPLMAQYNSIKAKYPDAILLFRVGDFYETFSSDAILTSRILGIVLTKRANGSASHVELAGFPHHALDTYLPKLVRSGHRVAICDQLEDPKLTKKIVKRGVTELVTPGLATGDKLLDSGNNNYLAAWHAGKEAMGVSFLDISTGEFLVAEGGRDAMEKLLFTFQPAEVLVEKAQQKLFKQHFGERFYLFALEDWAFTEDHAREKLLRHFDTTTLKGFGIDGMTEAVRAAGASVHYLGETEHSNLEHIRSISRLAEEEHVWLDRFTVRNLELLHPSMEGGSSLFDVLDHTITAMGTRLLKRWILMPLKDLSRIKNRLDLVEELVRERDLSAGIATQLRHCGDLERMASKLSMRKINPREVVQLKRSLDAVAQLALDLQEADAEPVRQLAGRLHPCADIRRRMEDTLEEEAPVQLHKGNVIKPGISAELDQLRDIGQSGKEYLVRIQQREAAETGISSLKIGFNNVFGYYLEVTNRYKDQVPDTWIRKQTLTNAERYITPELKEYEEKILGAEDRIQSIEQQLYEELLLAVGEYLPQILSNAAVVATVDCLLNFAEVAILHNYRKPLVNDGYKLWLSACRHPVIEQHLPVGEAFVPNDLLLDPESQQIIILTGPNMAGKSALLRQAALNVCMAQMGCFIPAEAAEIGLVDKIFTRVGASDNISSGESTFMVEMTETASIMNNLSDRSLVILDEIGRGTSTYDGISIAWSLCEYLHQREQSAKVLFATHYHELNELENRFDRIVNYHIATRQSGNKVIFLRKLTKGGSQHSFGIHVARMAGMPKEIIGRADGILKELEQKHIGENLKKKLGTIPAQPMQLNIFGMEDPVWNDIRKELDELDINGLTPIEALLLMQQWKNKLDS